jgi:shikimate kinase
MNNNNIFLIGMMGTGKSTVGSLLSSKKNIPFFDMDIELEKLIDMPINEIFQDYGESRFRLIESSFFNEITKVNQYIYATGGGIILDKNNQNILKNSGITFFLDSSTDTLINRLKNDTKKRPLLEESISLNISKIFNDRYDLYKQSAHYIIKTDNLTPGNIVNQIITYFDE